MNRSLAILLCALPLAGFAAEIYSWVDKDGQRHFTQNPPAGEPYKRVTPELAPPVDSTPVRKPQQSASSGESETNKTREAGLKLKAETLERCAKARERIAFLEEKTARRLSKPGPDGEPVRFTDEDFDAAMKKAKTEADQSCN